MTLISDGIVEKITQMISTQMYIGQTATIKTNGLEVDFIKNNVSLLKTTKQIQNTSISFDSYCDLISSSNCNNQIITQKVKNYFILKIRLF